MCICTNQSATRASVFLQLVQAFFCNSCRHFSGSPAGRLPEVLQLFTSNYLVTVCFRLQAFFRKSCRQTSGSPAGRLPEVLQADFRKSCRQTSGSPAGRLPEVLQVLGYIDFPSLWIYVMCTTICPCSMFTLHMFSFVLRLRFHLLFDN